jgi:sugar phosphate isomerase/epimerase
MRLPLSYQFALPDDWRTSPVFASRCGLLRTLGFWGVELNMADPALVDPAALRSFLAERGLALSMLATGMTAKRMQLSLSHPDDETRARSVATCRQMIDWAAEASAGADPKSRTGIIIGFLKGGVAPDPEAARGRFRRSIAEIIPYAQKRSVAVLVEATNRYESSIANSLADACALLEGLDADAAQVLPDTFHMNIEEADMEEALRGARDRFTSVHLSDNNRLFPGLGAIDFVELFGFLEGLGFMGRLAVEGNARKDVETDLRVAAELLGPLLET